MIELQTFDNFLTPLRFFRPWKAVDAVNDDAAYHFFPPKWRQWLTPEYFIYLLLRISRTRSRPRLRIKGSITRLLLVFAYEKLPFYSPTERQKAKINNQANKIFIFFLLGVAGKRNLQLSTMRHAIYTHACCIYTNFWVAPANQNISLSWYMKKIFSKYLKLYISVKSAKVSGYQSHMRKGGTLVVSFRSVTCRFWYHQQGSERQFITFPKQVSLVDVL